MICAIQVFLFIFTIIATFSADFICITVVSQLCMELQILRSIFEKSLRSDKFILSVIKRHIRVIKYGEEICNELSNHFLIQYCILFLIGCFSNFVVQSVSIT